MIWRLRKHGFSNDEEEEAAEKKAIFFVGVTFLLLALYVTYESAKKLLLHEHPDESIIGIVLAIVSLIVMPWLAMYKKRIAAEINSRALRADALETLACSYLSLTLLVGLGANALFGWWWADPVAALGMVYFLVREGWEAIEEGRGNMENGEATHQTARLGLQRRRFDTQCLERSADAADFAARTGRRNACDAVSLDDERAGVDVLRAPVVLG